MPRYYCDYCDTYLTHDSPSVRKQHNAGYKHKANVRLYYQQYEAQLNQSLIDQKVKEHLGAFRPPGGPPLGVAYSQLRPGVAILPTPMMPMPGTTTFPPGAPFMSIRPPVLPRPPPGAPVYMSSTMPMPMMMAPPSGPLPGPPPTDIQRPPSMTAPPPIGMPPSSGAPSFYNPVYQGGAPPTSAAATGETANNAGAQAQAPEAADN